MRIQLKAKECLMLAASCLACYCILHIALYESRNKYLVFSPLCRIPDINPWDSSIIKFFGTKVHPVVCSTRPPLTYTSESGGRQHLHVDIDAVLHYTQSLRDIDCCYTVVERLTDSQNKAGLCVAFNTSTTLGRTVEHVYVECVSRAEGTQLYANVHAVVQAPISGEQTSKKQFNIVLLAIDTISRLNFERTMPQTAKFLKSSNWLEMRGYNKMADNTLPNLVTLLTGLDETLSRRAGCLLPNTAKTGYDNCPFIWKAFKRAGYVTAYIEDETDLSTFNYMSIGFRQKPTDFYLHPLMVQAFDKLKRVKNGGFSVCVGETSVTDLVLKNTLDLLKTFRNNLFAVTWLNNFSHDDYQLPATMDGKILEFFRTITKSKALESTLFIFFSDHGFRHGPIRHTHVGWLEESLPFLYFHLPPEFRLAYKNASFNLAANADRLTSPFDLYLTLRDMLDGVDAPGLREGTEGCPKCQSLFRLMDENRSCQDAGIPEQWCTCLERTPVDKSSLQIKLAAEAVVAHVNKKMKYLATEIADGEECAVFSVGEIISAEIVVNVSAVDHQDFGVLFTAVPGAVVLHSTVRSWVGGSRPRLEVLGMVSRVSQMHQESCPSVTDKTVEYYCQCVFSAAS